MSTLSSFSAFHHHNITPTTNQFNMVKPSSLIFSHFILFVQLESSVQSNHFKLCPILFNCISILACTFLQHSSSEYISLLRHYTHSSITSLFPQPFCKIFFHFVRHWIQRKSLCISSHCPHTCNWSFIGILYRIYIWYGFCIFKLPTKDFTGTTIWFL